MKLRSIWITTLFLSLLLVVVSACGPAATSTPTSSTPTPASPPAATSSPMRQRTSGTLTKIDGNILTLTTAQGTVTVTVSSDNTTVRETTTGTLSDLTEGTSIFAIGPQDANGNIAATSIIISSLPRTAPAPRPGGASPSNSGSPRTGSHHGASGTLTKIDGNILTLTTGQGTVTVTVSSDNTTIRKVAAGSLSDLHEGETLSVSGPRDANGNVVANAISVGP